MTPVLKRFGATTFDALQIPNFRLYLAGQGTSMIGTWMQTTAQAWLVVQLTGSATKLGLIIALQTLPVLVLGPYSGVVADRVNKRKFMIVLQVLMGLQALAFAVLAATGTIRYWEIGVLAVILGVSNVFENPVRQSFMMEMIGPEKVRNAISLNSTAMALSRTIGPAIAGILIGLVGESACFFINAASFFAVIASLVRIDTSALHPTRPIARAKGQLREGLAYIRRTRPILIPLVMVAAIGCLAFEFQVSLPYMAAKGLHVGASGYGFMTASLALGSVVGAMLVASRGKVGSWALVSLALGFGVSMTLAALAPNLALMLLALALVGGTSIAFMSTSNSTLQLRADPKMRGRVMSIWFVGFQGSTPIGGPIVGAVMSAAGARAGLGVGAIACFAVAIIGGLTLRHVGVPMQRPLDAPPIHPVPDVETGADAEPAPIEPAASSSVSVGA
jgi:MFS family permease